MYQEWLKRSGYSNMQDYFDIEFWDLVHQEYGEIKEMELTDKDVMDIVQPIPGIFIVVTRDFYNE